MSIEPIKRDEDTFALYKAGEIYKSCVVLENSTLREDDGVRHYKTKVCVTSATGTDPSKCPKDCEVYDFCFPRKRARR